MNSGPATEVLPGTGSAFEAGAGAVPSRTPHARDAADVPAGLSLLELLERPSTGSPTRGFLEEFLRAESPRRALASLFGSLEGLTLRTAIQSLTAAVGTLDSLLTSQLNEILHHPAFQKLEASWRGVAHLVRCAAEEEDPHVKVKVLNCSWREIERERPVEFDQSQVFRKVYEEHFGMPGGEPLGLLIGDYEIHPELSAEHPYDDVELLSRIAGVAAAAFCPFVASASPTMFEIDDFAELELVRDVERRFSSPKFLRWRTLRESDDARFVGLVLPHVLMRPPYADDGSRVDGFRFIEDVSGPDRSKYLWGNASYALGETAIRAFARTGWLATLRGVERGVEGGGLVSRLPAPSFDTDRPGIAPQGATDTIITDIRERELSEQGFIPLCRCHDSELSAFYTCSSIQKPKRYDTVAATQNARISAMLEYMLCVSQFARYVKVITRDMVGSFQDAKDCQKRLSKWLMQYVTPVANPTPQVKATHPLREAQIDVVPIPGRPGSFNCTVRLVPHFQLDNMTASVTFKTELAPVS